MNYHRYLLSVETSGWENLRGMGKIRGLDSSPGGGGEEEAKHRFWGICREAEVAFLLLGLLRKQLRKRERKRGRGGGLGRVQLIQGRSLPFCRYFTTLITRKQAAPPIPPLSLTQSLSMASELFCGHQVNEDADEEKQQRQTLRDRLAKGSLFALCRYSEYVLFCGQNSAHIMINVGGSVTRVIVRPFRIP